MNNLKDENKVKLSLKSDNREIQVSFEHSDVSADELLEAFVVLLRGATFPETVINEALELYIESQNS